MKLRYSIKIESPETHQALVTIEGKKRSEQTKLTFFLPRWSPGSYLIREYSRHLSNWSSTNTKGEHYHFEQSDISTFTLDFSKSDVQLKEDHFIIQYRVFCHELTVRTSHIDQSHAFLHLPTLLMGVLNEKMEHPELRLWLYLFCDVHRSFNRRLSCQYSQSI